jgi:SNF2 family DNA or RNA helicase
MSKSPVNAYDQFDFLAPGYFSENMYEFAEKYCILETLRTARGRRILISQKTWGEVRKRLKNAYIRGGKAQLLMAKEFIYQDYGIGYKNQDWIIAHKKYSPFIRQRDLLKRIAKDSMFVRREDVFDIRFDKFVKEPIKVPVGVSPKAKAIAKELISLGFTDNLTLGKAPALELMIRLQDVCNGFEPTREANSSAVSLVALDENPKLDALLALLEEIDVEENQVVVWSSRTALLSAASVRLRAEDISCVVYDGSATDKEKSEAEHKFQTGEAKVFIANQASGAFGLNCLAKASYAVYLCVDGSVERYYQSQHRILRGQLTSPKFAYAIYVEGSIEERLWEALRVGKTLIDGPAGREVFEFSKEDTYAKVA